MKEPITYLREGYERTLEFLVALAKSEDITKKGIDKIDKFLIQQAKKAKEYSIIFGGSELTQKEKVK